MTKEQFITIRASIKAEIKNLTEIQKHNKKARNHNNRYCEGFSKKYNPDAEIIPLKKMNGELCSTTYWECSIHGIYHTAQKLSVLHVYYNKFRNKKSHTTNDDYYLGTALYKEVSAHFESLLEETV